MSKSIISLCIILFVLIVSCQPPTVLYTDVVGMVHEDKSGGWERIEQMIFRYQNGDTSQYLLNNDFDLRESPMEIRTPYVCYLPKERSGILGLHIEEKIESLKSLKRVLPSSEMQDYRNILSNEIYFFPLYQYQIRDSVICFRIMTREERMTDTQENSSAVYAIEDRYRTRKLEPEFELIFYQIYDVKCKYLIGSDTLSWLNKGYYCENHLTNIPMFHLPLKTNVYYKKNLRKYLVKERLGFCPAFDAPKYNRLADYSYEVDTALLALPVRIFQEEYIRTKDIYCLDGLEVTYK